MRIAPTFTKEKLVASGFCDYDEEDLENMTLPYDVSKQDDGFALTTSSGEDWEAENFWVVCVDDKYCGDPDNRYSVSYLVNDIVLNNDEIYYKAVAAEFLTGKEEELENKYIDCDKLIKASRCVII